MERVLQGGLKKWYLSYITLHCTRVITFLAHPVAPVADSLCDYYCNVPLDLCKWKLDSSSSQTQFANLTLVCVQFCLIRMHIHITHWTYETMTTCLHTTCHNEDDDWKHYKHTQHNSNRNVKSNKQKRQTYVGKYERVVPRHMGD